MLSEKKGKLDGGGEKPMEYAKKNRKFLFIDSSN